MSSSSCRRGCATSSRRTRCSGPSSRWEHWPRGAYEAFRRGYSHHRNQRYREAHAAYTQAARLAPGNMRVTLHHGGLHEDRTEFRRAANTYNAGRCLWRQNIDVSYRLAAATVNYVVVHDGKPPAQARALIGQANQALASANRRLKTRSVVRRLLRTTFHPRRRDPGERRYWYSWLRADAYPASLRFLRRSKGHEYRCALSVAIASNDVLLHSLNGGALLRNGDPSVEDLWERVVAVTRRRRSGWLAHWSAACFFSRAMDVPSDRRPHRSLWKDDWAWTRSASLTQFSKVFDDDATPAGKDDWRAYCGERAVLELGRVVRNPSSQLDRRLVADDPDMRRLLNEPIPRVVAVLAGMTSGMRKAPWHNLVARHRATRD